MIAAAPKVSVITPCYNSARFIAVTIESVRAQTLTEWEHIVVDDGSTDDGAAVVREWEAKEPRLRLVAQPNGGVASARNAGFRASAQNAEYLLFLDADDCLEPEMLEKITRYMDDHTNVGMVHCGHRYIDDTGELLPERHDHIADLPRYVPGKGVGKVEKLSPNVIETPFVSVYNIAGIVPSVCVMRRDVYEQTPGWDEAFGQHHEDTDVFLQFAIRSVVHFLPDPLVRYRRHSQQNTSDPARFGRQMEKMYEKWASLPGLTDAQQAVVREAEAFRTQRLAGFIGSRAALQLLRQGRVGAAARFGGGALRRYLADIKGSRYAAKGSVSS